MLDAVAENAARLCDANNAEIFRLEDNLLRLAASYGEIPVVIHAYQGVPINRDTVTGRAACDRRTIHVHDLAAEEGEYLVGSSNAKREGHRTTLATPLLRQGTPIGIILARRMEIRPFSDRQIALLETFADEAVIAIENVRLFEAEKQRTLALAHANRDLAEREARIRRLVDANIIGIFIWDLDGRIIEANDAFLRMVDYDHDDLVSGRIRWTELTPPEWRDPDVQRWLPELEMTGSLQPFEKEYFRKDGNRVPVLIGVATFEEGGNQGVAFVLDLTKLNPQSKPCGKANTSSAKSSIRYQASSGRWDPMVNRPMSVSAFWTTAACNLRILSTVVGRPSYIRPTFQKPLTLSITQIQTGAPYQAVHRLRRADGEYRWYHARGEPLRDREGRIVQWYGLSVDIDEGKKAEEALRESERNSRSALDGIASLVSVLAPNGEVETVNRQCLEYFGRSLEWINNWETNDAVHPEDLPALLNFIRERWLAEYFSSPCLPCRESGVKAPVEFNSVIAGIFTSAIRQAGIWAMSAIGTKRTSLVAPAHVRFGCKADMTCCTAYVRL